MTARAQAGRPHVVGISTVGKMHACFPPSSSTSTSPKRKWARNRGLKGRLRIVPSLFKLLSDRDNKSHYSILSTLALSFGWVHGGLGARWIWYVTDADRHDSFGSYFLREESQPRPVEGLRTNRSSKLCLVLQPIDRKQALRLFFFTFHL